MEDTDETVTLPCITLQQPFPQLMLMRKDQDRHLKDEESRIANVFGEYGQQYLLLHAGLTVDAENAQRALGIVRSLDVPAHKMGEFVQAVEEVIINSAFWHPLQSI